MGPDSIKSRVGGHIGVFPLGEPARRLWSNISSQENKQHRQASPLLLLCLYYHFLHFSCIISQQLLSQFSNSAAQTVTHHQRVTHDPISQPSALTLCLNTWIFSTPHPQTQPNQRLLLSFRDVSVSASISSHNTAAETQGSCSGTL